MQEDDSHAAFGQPLKGAVQDTKYKEGIIYTKSSIRPDRDLLVSFLFPIGELFRHAIYSCIGLQCKQCSPMQT